MIRCISTIVVLAVSTLAQISSSAFAQSDWLSSHDKGVVWSPTGSFSDVRIELEEISQHGANAVRLPLVFDRDLYEVADLHELSIYQEIDAHFLPAERILQRKDRLIAALDSALQIASRAGGEHRFGLGYWVDTSTSETCDSIRELAEYVHQRLVNAKTYYVSAFIESDQCAEAVDFVLLDARDTGEAIRMIERWRAHSSVPVGIAGIGYSIRDGAAFGYRNRYSEEFQARMLENDLAHLLRDDELVAVFVNRWKHSSDGNFDDGSGDFGILAPDGTPRLAAHVVKGLYTGNQEVFAIDAGGEPGGSYSWLNLISALCVALFGLTYYGSIGLRSIVRRYFLSHSIYLEKLGDGREATVGTSMFLLLCLSLAASIVGMTVLADLAGTQLWFPILAWLPDWLAAPLSEGVIRTGLLVPFFASMFALVTIVWAATLSLSTRGSKHLRFGQALLVAVMPRWPVALIGLLALVILNWEIDAPGYALIGVIGVWLAVVLTYTGRMFSDFLRLLGIKGLWTIPVLLLALVLVAGMIWLVMVSNDLRPEIDYLWHIASGT